MTMTNPPPVAPVEGHYALLRNGESRGPIIRDKNVHTGNDFFICSADNVSWNPIGDSDCGDAFDIIATISPTDMQAVASGRLAELIDRVLSLPERVVQSDVNCGQVYDYVHVDLTDVVELKHIATALQGDAP